MTETSNKNLSKEEDVVKTLACDHDWSNHHEDIIIGFVERVVSMKDFIAFRGVSKSWRSAAVKENSNRALRSDHTVPVLFCPKIKSGLIYSLTKRELSRLDLPETEGYGLYNKCYSSMGWLLLIKSSSEIHLLNPLTHALVKLPYLSPEIFPLDSEVYMMGRFVLSSSPSLSSSYGVMLHSRSYMVFYSPSYKNNEWTRIALPAEIADTTYWKGQFYAIIAMDFYCRVFVCEMEDPDGPPRLRIVAPQFPFGQFSLTIFWTRRTYLVQSATEEALWLVVATNMEDLSGRIRVFEVPINNDNDWCWSSKSEVKNLGNRSLFLGPNGSSFSIETLVDDSICKANCIYFNSFIDQSYHSEHRTVIYIYHMEDGKIERKFEFNEKIGKTSWIQPSF